ncbi:hypothetical protein EVAR_46203_1 [Eumeta japonica]|uniref:Uncharacterized protein n=1 Tax=Eumeta variegata TaxID=151549 RepID=A0A4C1WGD3_EUMVA|nr:hypothetical protein EVAR_46203_1 [Eumeta japonica]
MPSHSIFVIISILTCIFKWHSFFPVRRTAPPLNNPSFPVQSPKLMHQSFNSLTYDPVRHVRHVRNIICGRNEKHTPLSSDYNTTELDPSHAAVYFESPDGALTRVISRTAYKARKHNKQRNLVAVLLTTRLPFRARAAAARVTNDGPLLQDSSEDRDRDVFDHYKKKHILFASEYILFSYTH